MKKLVIIFVLGIFSCSFGAMAQLNINSSGNVGIDTSSALSRMSIGNDGASNIKVSIYNSNAISSQIGLGLNQVLTTDGWSYGTISNVTTGSSGAKVMAIKGNAYKSTVTSIGMSYGVYGIAGNAQSGLNYAVFGQLYGSNNGAAIFGATPTKLETTVNGIYAGYFRGNVYVEDNIGVGVTNPGYKLEVNGDINAIGNVKSYGIVLTSDSTKKTDIQTLGIGNLSKLNSLKVVTFKYKQPDLNAEKLGILMPQDTGKVESSLPSAIPNPEMYQQMQIGLLAQDLQKVYPDLVIADKEGILGINYTGLVAVLVAAVKEQQAEIEELKQQIGK
jgi:hypothetical protein